MAQDRIALAFERARQERRPALILYLTVGYPTVKATLDLVPALLAAGADAIELGVPFSDPMADGPVIQEAGFHALRQGVTPRQCLDVAAELRRRGVQAPLLLMGYYNPILAHGLDAWADAAHSAGVDGAIVPDLPPDEAGPLRRALASKSMHLVPLLAPTSTDARIARACTEASGFIYCVSLTGVTGARAELPSGISDLVARVKRQTTLPVVVGFGISTREHVRVVGQSADGAVVGSALVRTIGGAKPGHEVESAVALVAELRGAALKA
jgi:tryptophan synthase alpha chain